MLNSYQSTVICVVCMSERRGEYVDYDFADEFRD